MGGEAGTERKTNKQVITHPKIILFWTDKENLVCHEKN